MRLTGSNLTKVKTAITTFPLQYEAEITYTKNNQTITLDNDDLIYINYFYDGDILKSNMQGLTIECIEEIEKDTAFTFNLKIKTGNTYTTLNYGTFNVIEVEKKEDTNSYLMTCYDDMIKSMVDYVTPPSVTYPIQIGDYYEALCNYLGISFASKVFANSTKEIPSELYANLGYKFRDVFDEISQCSGTSMCMNLNNVAELRTPVTTNDTINKDYLNENNVKIGEQYGAVNTLVLSRSAESDNVYYPSVLPQNPIELKIVDNQIMNRNDRSEYLQAIANNVFGLIYCENDYSSSNQGIMYYEFLDKYNITIDNTAYPCLMLNDNLTINQDISENIYSKVPKISQTDYSKADTTDKRINQAYVIVDKMKGEIEAKVDKDGIIASLNLAVEDNQGVITIQGNNFVLDTDNASIDKYGNTELENVKVRGGSIELEDDGTQENAGLKIDTLYKRVDDITNGVDLSDKYIVFNFKNKTYNELVEYNNITILADGRSPAVTLKLRCYEDEREEQYLDVYTTHYSNQEPVEVILKTIKFEDGVIIENFNCYSSSLVSEGGLFQIFTIIDDSIMNNIKYLSVNQTKETSYGGYGIEADILIPDNVINYNNPEDIRDILDGVKQSSLYYLQGLDFDRDGVITEDDYDIGVAYDNAKMYYQEKGHLSISNKFANNNIVGKDGEGTDIFNFGIGTGGYVKDLKVDTMELNNTDIYSIFQRKPVILFDYPSGSTDYSNTLNDYIENYKYVEILFKNNDGIESSVKVQTFGRSNILVCLNSATLDNNMMWQQYGVFKLNSDKITREYEKLIRFSNASVDYLTNETIVIAITKIIGYYD